MNSSEDSKSSLPARQFSAIELEEAGDWKQPSKGSPDYHDPNAPARLGRRRMDWAALRSKFWMVLPIFMHLASIGTLAGAMVTRDFPFLTVKEVLGTGQLDYGIFTACAIAPGTTERVCQPHRLAANYLTSLLAVSTTMPKVTMFQLPIRSVQTPLIFISALVLLVAALPVILLPWSAVYFPKSFLVKRTPIGSLARNHAKTLYTLGGSLAFVAFILMITIGIGFEELMFATVDNYTIGSRIEIFLHANGGVWEAKIGPGFGLVWAASTLSALVAVGTNVALHNGLDEIAARDETDRRW